MLRLPLQVVCTATQTGSMQAIRNGNRPMVGRHYPAGRLPRCEMAYSVVGDTGSVSVHSGSPYIASSAYPSSVHRLVSHQAGTPLNLPKVAVQSGRARTPPSPWIGRCHAG